MDFRRVPDLGTLSRAGFRREDPACPSGIRPSMIQSGKLTPAIRTVSISVAVLLHLAPFVWLLHPRARPVTLQQPLITRVTLVAPAPLPPPVPLDQTPPTLPPSPVPQDQTPRALPPSPMPAPVITQEKSPVQVEPAEPAPETREKEPEEIPDPEPPSEISPESSEPPSPAPTKRQKKEPMPEVAPPPTPIQHPTALNRKTAKQAGPLAEAPLKSESLSDGLSEASPALRHSIKPVYPLSARKKGLEGTVVCLVKVSKGGRAEKASVMRSSGHRVLDTAALRAVRKARFVPARRAGRDIPSETQLTFVFRLEDAR